MTVPNEDTLRRDCERLAHALAEIRLIAYMHTRDPLASLVTIEQRAEDALRSVGTDITEGQRAAREALDVLQGLDR